MSEIRVDSIGNESNTGGPVLSGITTFSGQQYFIPPKGTTTERPSDCPPGSIRFNTDSAHLEYWNGSVWLEFEASSEDLGDQNNTNSSGGTGTRGIIFGGYGGSPASAKNTIDYLTIPTLGNTQDFGDISGTTNYRAGAAASRTRGIMAGGIPETADIHFVTIASTGDSTDFSNLTDSRRSPAGCGGQTRAIFGGGFKNPTHVDIIDAFTIASTADAIDFGDLSVSRARAGAFSSSVRAIFGGGLQNPTTELDTIDYVTISTQGNAQDFGNLTQARWSISGASNSTRGLWGGGYTPTMYNIIDFVTIASTGNAQDFGDLNDAKGGCAAMASSTRALWAGGETPTVQNAIDFVEIVSTGNGVDFGDISSSTKTLAAGCSNGHGGL